MHTHTHIDPLLSLYRKNNKKWFTDLNVKSKTIKLLLENMGESVDSWPRQRFFLDTISKGQFIKNKLINYIPLILKTSVLQKDTAKRMKR